MPSAVRSAPMPSQRMTSTGGCAVIGVSSTSWSSKIAKMRFA